jgi:hypothetical protein
MTEKPNLFGSGQPLKLKPDAELKTNYKDPAKRYELAERMVWDKTPNWKRGVIVKGKLTGDKYVPYDKIKNVGIDGGAKDDRIINEYAQEIVQLAEGETALDDKLPPVPAFTLESEAAEAAANPS